MKVFIQQKTKSVKVQYQCCLAKPLGGPSSKTGFINLNALVFHIQILGHFWGLFVDTYYRIFLNLLISRIGAAIPPQQSMSKYNSSPTEL